MTLAIQIISSPRRDKADGCAKAWTLIKRAIQTHDALPGARRQSLVAQVEIVREFQEAYGYNEARPPKFTPTPRDVSNMLPVLAWLCWIRQQPGHGNRDFKLLAARARKAPWWKLAQRFGRCERTIQRWFDGAVAQVYDRFEPEVWDLETPRNVW
jgi:hypothetical protein